MNCADAMTRVGVLTPNAIDGAIARLSLLDDSRGPATPPSCHSAFTRTAALPKNVPALPNGARWLTSTVARTCSPMP